MRRRHVNIEKSIEDVLLALHDNPEREGLQETPKRVAKHLMEHCKKLDIEPKNFTVFDAEGYQEMVILKDIQTYSTCEHHMMPFEMKIHIGYIPTKKIVGISKLARMAEVCSRGLQIQERITYRIVTLLDALIQPKGAGCIVEGIHSCIRARGVKQQSSIMITSAMRGIFKDSIATRDEFLRLIGK